MISITDNHDHGSLVATYYFDNEQYNYVLSYLPAGAVDIQLLTGGLLPGPLPSPEEFLKDLLTKYGRELSKAPSANPPDVV